VQVIPFNLTNHGNSENFYFYTLKGQFKKGANRLCTTLWHVTQRIRNGKATTHAEKAQKLARHLILIADNYSENKNNTLLAFCNELIYHKLFDKITLLYGPVGHTHNGGDAVHNIHNNLVGNFESVSLPEFFNYFYSAWTSEKSRPQPVIIDVQYDWDGHYDGHIRTLANLNKVRAIKVERGTNGFIEVHLKSSPRHSQWCGQKGLPDAPGFVMFLSLPLTLPKIIDPKPLKMSEKEFVSMKGKKIRRYCEALGRSLNLEWTLDMVRLGRIPPGKPVTDVEIVKKHRQLMSWEVLEEIGVPGYTAIIPFLRAKSVDTIEDFFSVDYFALSPAAEAASQSTVPSEPLPVRYSDEPVPSKSIKRKIVVEDSDEDEAPEEEEKEEKSGTVSTWETWASFSLCHKGVYAVVKIDYAGKGGISVLKVFVCLLCALLCDF
jgi:hypothetical protein